jgi:hypothetical protein
MKGIIMFIKRVLYFSQKDLERIATNLFLELEHNYSILDFVLKSFMGIESTFITLNVSLILEIVLFGSFILSFSPKLFVSIQQ